MIILKIQLNLSPHFNTKMLQFFQRLKVKLLFFQKNIFFSQFMKPFSFNLAQYWIAEISGLKSQRSISKSCMLIRFVSAQNMTSPLSWRESGKYCGRGLVVTKQEATNRRPCAFPTAFTGREIIWLARFECDGQKLWDSPSQTSCRAAIKVDMWNICWTHSTWCFTALWSNDCLRKANTSVFSCVPDPLFFRLLLGIPPDKHAFGILQLK